MVHAVALSSDLRGTEAQDPISFVPRLSSLANDISRPSGNILDGWDFANMALPALPTGLGGLGNVSD